MSNPPIKCTPCRLTYNDRRYRIYVDGPVSESLPLSSAKDLGLKSLKDVLDYESTLTRYDPHSSEARTIRREAARLRRNRNARERSQTMRDLGMKRTPYGWE